MKKLTAILAMAFMSTTCLASDLTAPYIHISLDKTGADLKVVADSMDVAYPPQDFMGHTYRLQLADGTSCEVELDGVSSTVAVAVISIGLPGNPAKISTTASVTPSSGPFVQYVDSYSCHANSVNK